MKYRAEIDGLRALAVMPVILFHAGFDEFSGGFVGVDVFFVISGYLITTIITNEMNEGRFSLINFYERRARRILPALLLVVLVCIPFAWLWLVPMDMNDFAQSVVAVAAFSSNILFWLESDYFDTAAELKPLLHTWSLAVEEQYYILFPLFLMATWRFGRKVIVAVLAAVFLLSLGFAQWAAYEHPSAAFYLLPARGWELLMGVFGALYLQRSQVLPAPDFSGILSFAGLSMIVLSVFLYSENTPFPGLYALLPTVGTLLVILFGNKGTLANRVLSAKPLVGIGLISYSAYLWHQPIIAFWKYLTFGVGISDRLLLILVTFLVSAVTWRFVEVPARKKSLVSRGQVFAGSGISIIVLIAIGLHGHFNGGYLNRDVSFSMNISHLDYEEDNRKLQQQSWSLLRELSGDSQYYVEGSPFDRTLWFDVDDPRPKMLLVGNSHSKDLWNVLRFSDSASRNFQVARYGIQVRNILTDGKFLESPNFEESDIVVLVSRFDNQGRDAESLTDVAEMILSHGKRLVVFRNIFEFPRFRGGLLNLADKVVIESYMKGERDGIEISKESNRVHFSQYVNEPAIGEVNSTDRAIEKVINDYADVLTLDRMDYICSKPIEQCFSLDERLNKYFYDYGHHTLAGALFFGKRVDEIDLLSELISK